MKTSKIKTTIYFIIGAIIVLLLSTLLFSLFTIHRLKTNLSIQVQTRTLILTLKDNLAFLLDAETGERGYIITGDTSYLEPYNVALQNIAANQSRLKSLTRDNPLQQKNVDSLTKYSDLKISYTRELILLKSQGKEEDIRLRLISGQGKYFMNRVRSINRSMQSTEEKLFVERKGATEKSIENARVIFILEGLAAALITLFLALTIINELNKRAKTEKKLNDSLTEIETIIRNAPNAVIIINDQGLIIKWSLQAEIIFGWKAEEVLNKPMHEFIMPPNYREAHHKGFYHFLRTGEGPILGKTLELSALRKNNIEFPIDLRISATMVDEKYLFIAFINDITERKLKEMELSRKNQEIEQFAYIASHDLQEPLRTISNFSKLLSQKLQNHSDKEAEEYMGYILNGANRMSVLIFNLLEYSRIGKDRSKIIIDCDKLLNELLMDMKTTIHESGAKIQVEKLPTVNGYVYLKSLFQNLISNAIKFKKPESPPLINISVSSKANEFLFSVSDSGIGIEKEYYQRIFTIFQRLHTRHQYPGTGIGLSLCQKIVEVHGGKIWVQSELGKGTTFYFTIPKN
ncbi:MAG: CHASE3 domain-containing protein [Bacteroidia bacterium]